MQKILTDSARNDHNNTSSIWECRYFSQDLPKSIKFKEPGSLFESSKRFRKEKDIYLITKNSGINIKLRKRKPRIKIKKLIQRTSDEFELWRTEVDSTLPAPIDVWDKVLSALEQKGDAQTLSCIGKPDQVIKALQIMNPEIRTLEIEKKRKYFVSSSARLEVCKLMVGTNIFYSVSFESPDLLVAREVRKNLSKSDLGHPENYVSFTSRLAG